MLKNHDATLEQQILDYTAQALRNKGYADCTPENLLTEAVYADAAREMLQHWVDDGNPRIIAVVNPMITALDVIRADLSRPR